jgi:hypothetical protein
MAKVEKKEKKTGKDAVVSTYQASDLSLEKRVELYQKEFDVFKEENSKKYGLVIDCEIAVLPKGIFPRMVLVDLTKKNEQANQEG